jgi:hypothetical protein
MIEPLDRTLKFSSKYLNTYIFFFHFHINHNHVIAQAKYTNIS